VAAVSPGRKTRDGLGGHTEEHLGSDHEGGGMVKLIKRFAIAVGSLAALVLAGGAHMRF
jgi:hypothetical protein